VENGKAWFSVIDNGTGINPDDLPKIFDLFYRANVPSADSRRGIGLGLAICKAIVNAHGGKIYAGNNESGGATIRFYLPMRGSANLD
jgi:two-component system sensor histidine kinase KdpD